MPTSPFDNVSVVMNFVVDLRPRRILDVGIGCGKYGMLCREYLDLGPPERYSKDDWQTQIIGIETFEGYHNPIWDYAYDRVLIGDAAQLAPGLGTFDLTLFIDVIEHLPKDQGRALLDRLLSQSTYVILSSPRYPLEQQAVHGNEAERHVSDWSLRDLEPYHIVYRERSRSFIALLSNSPIPRQIGRDTADAAAVRRALLNAARKTWAYRLYRAVRWGEPIRRKKNTTQAIVRA